MTRRSAGTIFEDLRAYCARDTMATVEVLAAIRGDELSLRQAESCQTQEEETT